MAELMQIEDKKEQKMMFCQYFMFILGSQLKLGLKL